MISQKLNQHTNNVYAMSRNPKIPFQGGLKANLRIGEQALKEFRREFPKRFESNTFVDAKITLNSDCEKFVKIRPELEKLARYYSAGIEYMRSQLKGNYPNLEAYIHKLKQTILKEQCANCGEHANLVWFNLLNKGLKPNVISMNIYRIKDIKKIQQLTGFKTPQEVLQKLSRQKIKEIFDINVFKNHGFPVLGVKKKFKYPEKVFKFHDPNTWGTQAVSVDAWLNFTMPVREALEHYKQILGFDDRKHLIQYECVDIIPIN